jgi:hypothetical protein
MTDAATLRSQLENLKAARATGAREIWIGERRVQYRSDRELAAAISALETEFAAAAGAPKPSTVIVRGDKGFL